MGETVAAYLARVAWRFEMPTVCRINGEFYGRAEWETRALAVNDNIEFISRPLDGGGRGGSVGKSIVSVLALVALTAAAGPIGTSLATAIGASGFAATAITSLTTAVIVGAGSLAISHFLSPKSGGKTNSTDALYSFGLQGNAARPMQPIPVLNGRLRFAPDYGAPTYSEYAGDAMTDYALYALTCGRMRVEQVLIGDTPIWDYQNGYSADYPGIEIQIVEPGEQVTLYPVNVVTADELTGAELSQTYTPGYIVNAAGTQAKELLFDFVWPGGAYVTYKDRTLPATTHVEIQARKVDDAGAPITGWTTIVSDPYEQAKQSQIRMTVRRLVEPGRYEVRGRRVNPSINDSGISKIGGTDDVTWTAARAHIEGPQSFPRVTMMAVKGVASKQLTGVSGGQLRVIGTRILPVWRDGQFVEEPTRSIAWAALDWWRNSDYAAGLSISDIDFQSFVRHDALWTALGHTFDQRFTEVQNLDDVLETVLKAGRAFPAPVGDKLTITRDEPRGLSRMLFTDNDIVRDTLEIDYALSDEAWADGMVGEYLDETTWRLAEVSSAPDGVTLLKPARVQLEGVVNRKQATGMIRMMAAESQYRRITVQWTARMEGRLLKRGDLVRITTEEPETWGQSCEVVGFDPATRRLSLDPAPTWEAGSTHYVEIRRRDGSPWGPVRVTRGANDAEAIVSVSEAGGVTLADAVGRSSTQEPAWLAFSPGHPRSFPVLVTDGDPDQDGEHIHLSGVIDAPEVYATTEDGVPPLLQVPDLYSSAMPVILGLMAQITQRQAALILTAGWQPAKNAVSYEAQASYDAGATWIGAYEGDRTTFEAVVGGSDQMKVRVRGVTPTGPRGAWYVVDVEAPTLSIPGELVDVTTLPPIDYAGLTQDVRNRIDYILSVEAYAIGVAAQARADFLAADGKAQDALNRALESLGNDAANAAAILREEKTRTDETSALAYSLEVVVAKSNDNAAAILREETARTTAVEAVATSLESVRAQTESNSAALTAEQTARADGDSANASSISGLRADVNTHVSNLSGFIVDERTVRADADGALSTRIEAVVASAGYNTAAITAEQTARADGDSANATSINTLRAEVATHVGNLSGFIADERQIRADQDGVLAQSINSVAVKAGNDLAAAISVESTARYNADAALGEQVTAVFARTDAGTAQGRMTISARSDISGVSARFETLLATQVGGQTYGAGFYIDLMPDGRSRYVIDADAFYITKNGQSTPAFQFDGHTLTIPSLRVTQQAMLPGASTDPISVVVQNVDAGGASAAFREIPGCFWVVNPDSALWTITFCGTAIGAVTASGSPAAGGLASALLEIFLGVDGVPYPNDKSTSAFCAIQVSSGAGLAPIPNSAENTSLQFSLAGLRTIVQNQSRRFSLLYRFQLTGAGSATIKYAQLEAVVTKR
ncbi:host specificity factor TipJ family phage tail protein [Methylorubrum zatmanii]